YPCRTDVVLKLRSSSNVAVRVKRENNKTFRLANISNASVTIRKQSGNGLAVYSGKTDVGGVCSVPNVPLGVYEIKVIPPEETGLQSQQKIVELEDEISSVTFLYQDGFEIERKLMFVDTHEEVRNFALRLFRDSMED